jgi:hypothetical protein
MGYYEGEIGSLCGNNNNNGWNDWSWIIGLAVVGGIFGNGGFGFGNGGNRGACATQADLSAGFNNSAVLSNLNDIILGQATMQNFINQGYAGLSATINSGFAGVDNAVCTLGYNTQAGFNALSTQIAQCCCDTRSAIADVKYANERNTCDIIRASQDNTRAILDYLTGEKIASLQAENTALKGRISDDYQADRIINKLSPCPSPSYIVPNPNCCYNYGVVPFGSCGASVQ